MFNHNSKPETTETPEQQLNRASLSVQNLELDVLIDLIKNLNEEQKKDYFNNLSLCIICYEDFLELETSPNLKLLMKLMKNKLIPESIYLDKNSDVLNSIYDKLSTYNESKSKFMDTIINEKEEIEKKDLNYSN